MAAPTPSVVPEFLNEPPIDPAVFDDQRGAETRRAEVPRIDDIAHNGGLVQRYGRSAGTRGRNRTRIGHSLSDSVLHLDTAVHGIDGAVVDDRAADGRIRGQRGPTRDINAVSITAYEGTG